MTSKKAGSSLIKMFLKMYNISYTKEAKQKIEKLSIKKKHQIKEAIERIAQNPRMGKRLTNELAGLLSYRSGDYRIIYRLYHEKVLIIILTVEHRKSVYEKLRRKK